MREEPKTRAGAARELLLHGLNPPQREAVTHDAGPLLVVAGPGSGKTRVITHRIAYLVRSGVAPSSILGITFTNKAAGEMRERIENLLGINMPWISTFHSFAARVLRRHIYRLTPFTTSFSIYDADDSQALVKECMSTLDISSSSVNARAVRGEISRMKNRGVEDVEVIPATAEFFERIVRKVFPRYTRALEERNALDFDDLLLFLVRLLQTQPDVLAYYRGQFHYVLIDEYQDTNQVQYRIGNLIAGEHRNICATGDPDQSIYSWRGADIRNILSFERDYGEPRVIKLEQNYRSTKRILRAANAVIRHNTERKPKELWTDNPEGDPVRVYCFSDSEEEASEIATLVDQFLDQGLSGRDIAIFYRVNSLSREIEQGLIRRGVPYRVVGAVEFFARKEIKDIVSYLRLMANPRDTEALRRIINTPARGIGKKTVEKVLEAAAASGSSPIDIIVDESLRPSGGARMKKALGGFAALYRKISALGRRPVEPLVRRIYTESGIAEMLEGLDPEESHERIANVEELFNAAAQFDAENDEGELEGFLQEIALYSPADRQDDSGDMVTLMTLHSAKGLEFPVVIICGLQDGLLPLRRADDEEDTTEEERRLFFVGLTRARQKLYVTLARRRLRYGQLQTATPSEFLEELLEDSDGDVEADRATRDAIAMRRRHELDWDMDAGGDGGDEGDEDAFDDDWDGFDEDPYPVGSRVRHAEYGLGTVEDSSGHGKKRRLTITFDEAGTRKIIAEYAELRSVT